MQLLISVESFVSRIVMKSENKNFYIPI